MKCKTCKKHVSHNNKSGRLSKWDIIKAGEAGWFFQKDETAYCPDHVPDWVPEWRAKQKPPQVYAHVAEKNTRLDSIKKGSLCIGVQIEGHFPGKAFFIAVEEFIKLHGREPDWDRTRFAGCTTTFQTFAELIEDPA